MLKGSFTCSESRSDHVHVLMSCLVAKSDVSKLVNNCCTSLICNLLSEKTIAEQIQERGG